MSNFKVLEHNIFFEGKTIRLLIEQSSNGKELKITRIQWARNGYDFYVEDQDGNDIEITDIVSEKVKSAFSTIYHEEYNLKNL